MLQRPTILALALLICPVVMTSAAKITLRGEPLQRQLLEDAGDRRLDDFDLVAAALIASGVDDEQQLADYRQRLETRFQGKLPNSVDLQARSAECLQLLHTHVLTGRYHVEYTDLSRVLDEGHFNCVTATVLYCHLCEMVGLEPIVVATREHVFVRFGGVGGWNVETTCAEWFQRSDRFSDLIVDSEAERREVGYTQLLGKVFYNRAVQLLAELRFHEAIELLQISLQLDPQDQPAEENLLAAINNWSLVACANEDYEQATELLDWGRELAPTYAPFATNDLHIHQKWTLDMCREHRFDQAIDILDAGFVRRPEAPVFDEGRLAVYRLWAEAMLVEPGEAAKASQVLEDARSQFAGDPRWNDYEVAALENAAKRLVAARRFEQARSVLRLGLENNPASSLLYESYGRLTDEDL
jgi:tetratricopeptide (TPR) repeat protein